MRMPCLEHNFGLALFDNRHCKIRQMARVLHNLPWFGGTSWSPWIVLEASLPDNLGAPLSYYRSRMGRN
jgi:hypothetical protein